MARASKKAKRPTDEFPPLRMVVENGRLVAAFPFDAERLDSWRNGSNMLVWMAPDGDRPLIRRWWATIGNYLKHTTLPWNDKETASAAIKLALALVNPFKTQSGQWSQFPRSLTEIDDEDLLANIRDMEQLLFQMTGVDVGTLRREAGADFGDEHFQPTPPAADNDAGHAAPSRSSQEDGAATSNSPGMVPDDPAGDASKAVLPIPGGSLSSEGASDDSGRAEVSSQDGTAATNSTGDREPDDSSGAIEPASRTGSAAATNSAQATTPETGAVADSGGADALTATVSAAAPELSKEDRAWLVTGARMMLATQPEPCAEAKTVLFNQVKAILSLMPKNASAEARTRLEQIKQHCLAVCRGEVELNSKLVAALAVSSVADITPAPIKTRSA